MICTLEFVKIISTPVYTEKLRTEYLLTFAVFWIATSSEAQDRRSILLRLVRQTAISNSETIDAI